MEVLPAIVESMQIVYFLTYTATLGSLCVFRRGRRTGEAFLVKF